jgi:hypothetical protein
VRFTCFAESVATVLKHCFTRIYPQDFVIRTFSADGLLEQVILSGSIKKHADNNPM